MVTPKHLQRQASPNSFPRFYCVQARPQHSREKNINNALFTSHTNPPPRSSFHASFGLLTRPFRSKLISDSDAHSVASKSPHPRDPDDINHVPPSRCTTMSGGNSWLARQRKSDLVELAQTIGLKEYVCAWPC